MPLISVYDLPAAIKSRSRFSSSGVQRSPGITRGFCYAKCKPITPSTTRTVSATITQCGCSIALRACSLRKKADFSAGPFFVDCERSIPRDDRATKAVVHAHGDQIDVLADAVGCEE